MGQTGIKENNACALQIPTAVQTNTDKVLSRLGL